MTMIPSVLVMALVAGVSQPQGAAVTDYLIGPQDVLTITVFEERQLSGRYAVDHDGSLTFPWIGRIAASGLTVRALEEGLMKLLADGYLKKPQVSVLVEQFRSRSIFVIGEVRTPGKYSLSGSMSLIEALAQAGSMTGAAGSEVLIIHPTGTRPGAGPLFPSEGGEAEVVRVSMKDLQSSRLSQNIAIRDGDTIFVPKADRFYVTGQVRNPGSFVLEKGMTVLQALSLAGDLNDRGSSRRIKIIRIVDGKKKEFSVKLGDLVQPGDTIVVRQRFF